MIFTTVILLMITLAKALLFVFPNLPETPPELVAFLNYTADLVASASAILQMVFSPALLVAMVVVITAVSLFDQIYWLALYLVKKIPFINIK